MSVVWEAVPHRTNRLDVFCDTPDGRYTVRRTYVARSAVYVVRLNNNIVGREESIAAAKNFVERRVNGDESG